MRNRIIEKSKFNMIVMSVFCFCAVWGSGAIYIAFTGFLLSPVRIMLILLVAAGLISGTKIVISVETKKVYLFWFLLLVYAGLSVFWVADQEKWINGMIYLIIGFLIMVLFLGFSGILNIMRYYRVVTGIMLAVSSIWGWYEMQTGNYLFVINARFLKMYSFVEKRAPVFAFGNTNNLALFITFALLLLFPMLFDESKLKKLTYIGLAVLSFPILLMTDSRANVIGLIIGIAVHMGFKMKRRITKAQTVLLFMALSAVILFFVLFWDNISNSLYEFFYFTGQKSSESISNISRTNSLKNAFLMIINSLGFGVGCGNSSAAANHVYNTLGVYDLHNWWLLILTEYGAVFGIAYYAVYFSQVKKLFKFIREEENDDYKQTMISFAAIDIAFVLCLLSPSSVVAIEWLWVYWGIRFSWINRYSLCLYNVE